MPSGSFFIKPSPSGLCQIPSCKLVSSRSSSAEPTLSFAHVLLETVAVQQPGRVRSHRGRHLGRSGAGEPVSSLENISAESIPIQQTLRLRSARPRSIAVLGSKAQPILCLARVRASRDGIKLHIRHVTHRRSEAGFPPANKINAKARVTSASTLVPLIRRR